MSAKVLAIAHRAANEPALLRAAVAAGADVVEADIWPYRGRLEVRHLKTMGLVPLLWDKWKLASGRAPRLLMAEMVDSLPAGVGLMLDLKGHDEEAARMIAYASRQIAGEGRLYVCARDWALLRPFIGGGATIVHSAGKTFEVARLQPLLESGDCTAISINQKFQTRALVQQFRQRAEIVMTWPVNDLPRMRELVSWGVNGITTDSLPIIRAMHAGEGEFAQVSKANDGRERGQ